MATKLTTDELKSSLGDEIVRQTDTAILAVYSMQTQIDYCTGVIVDDVAKAEMVDFIVAKRTEQADIIAAIETLTDVALLDNFKPVDDGTRWREVIDAKMTLSTDEHKDMVAFALREIKMTEGIS